MLPPSVIPLRHRAALVGRCRRFLWLPPGNLRGFFIENGKHYLVMDFISGRTLSEVLEKEGSIGGLNGARGVSEARARSWGQQICSVLNYLHRQNPPIIFRDLKPANIMVTDRD